MGRPTDNPKETMFRVRLDNTSKEKLKISSEALNTSQSEVVRQGIAMVYDSLKKK